MITKKQIFATLLAALALCGLAEARLNILITEVHYDPVGSEYDLEFIELYNPNDFAVEIGGWIINTTSSQRDATLPTSAIIPPLGYFLIADGGFNTSKDAAWPSADYEEEITLGNTAGGLILVGKERIEDIVGWGTNPPSAYFEGSPAQKGSEGQSLSRKKGSQGFIDTQNNLNDFVNEAPSPRNSKMGLQGGVNLEIELIIEENPPQVKSISVKDEDSERAGIQVFPFPGREKRLNVSVLVEDSSGIGDIKRVEVTLLNRSCSTNSSRNTTQNSGWFSCELGLPYYVPPGSKLITVSACDLSDCSSAALEIEIGEVMAFLLDTAKLTLGVNLGSAFQLVGDLDFATSGRPTLKNAGNTRLRFEVTSTGLRLNSSEIPPSAIAVAITQSEPNTFYQLSSVYRSEEYLQLNALQRFSLRFELPKSTPPGSYNGFISIKGLK